MRLARLMIRVLPKDHDPHPFRRREGKSVEYVRLRRKNGRVRVSVRDLFCSSSKYGACSSFSSSGAHAPSAFRSGMAKPPCPLFYYSISARKRKLKRGVRIECREVMFLEIHVVKRGDTLYSVGRMHGVAPGLIARCNGLREPYRLAVGQSLLILRPLLTYTVRAGDSLYSIARQFGVTVQTLYRNNPNLGGSSRIYPGQVLVIRLEEEKSRPLALNGYAYPFVSPAVLRGILPYAGYLAPFTYGITAQGGLFDLNDTELLALAEEYGTMPLMHLSTLMENGSFSSLRAEEVLLDPERQRN